MTQVAVSGQIWNYVEIGGGASDRCPILILHGWGRSGGEWIGMGRELSKWSGRKVYVLDNPGFGGSSLPHVKSIAEYSELVAKFCDYMGITKVVLLGHSLGGRIGIVLAATHPEIIEKLILVDAAGVKPKSIRRQILKVMAKMFSWVPRQIRAKVVGSVMDSDYKRNPGLRELYRAVVAEDLTKYLSAIKCEVGIVWGELDKILPLSLTRVYTRLLPHSSLRVVWGAGHDPHLDKYEVTKSILQEYTE
jgi:pimeloyl-ACP methyl ester carboxylesterase